MVRTTLPVIACSLSGEGQFERLSEWKSLLALAESRQGSARGMRFRFRRDLAERVRSLSTAEHECCSFLRFDLVEAGDDFVMTVETEESGQEALGLIFG